MNDIDLSSNSYHLRAIFYYFKQNYLSNNILLSQKQTGLNELRSNELKKVLQQRPAMMLKNFTLATQPNGWPLYWFLFILGYFFSFKL